MTFSNADVWPLLGLATVVLLALSWLAWTGFGFGQSRVQSLLPWGLRAIGIALVALAIADPLLLKQEPAKGANLLAVLADNSRGLQIKDSGDSANRAEIARTYLGGERSEWQQSLADTYQLRRYRFDNSLARIGDFETLAFDGQSSDIGESLLSLSQRLGGKPLSGILLFSDGNATDSPLPEEQLATLPPVFPVVIGSTETLPDLAVSSLKVQQSAFADSPLEITAGLSLANVEELPISSHLSQLRPRLPGAGEPLSWNLVETRNETVEASAAVSHSWRAPEGGIQFYSLAIESEGLAEENVENNRRLFAVDGGKPEFRLLYVAGRPNWEYKFLNRALAEDERLSAVGLIRVASKEPAFEFKGRAGENSNALYRGFGREDENERYDEAVLIRLGTRDERELVAGFPTDAETLFQYDAILIDDLEAGFFSFSQQTLIRDFVKQRGGGLLLMGGVNAFQEGGYANTPIAQALPVYLNTPAEPDASRPPVLWDLTRNGWVAPWTRIRSLDSDERARIQQMPPFLVYNPFERVRPGAETLITLHTPGSENFPALVTRRFGSGRVATLAVGDLWRWGLQDASTQADLAQFWRQLSRWLVTDAPPQISLTAIRQADRSVRLQAKVLGSDFLPMLGAEARVEVTNLLQPQEESSLVNMKPVAEEPGRYEAKIHATTEGAYLAKLQVVDASGETVGYAETGWVAQPLADEFANTSPDRNYLSFIAESTGGQLLELDQLDQLPELLNRLPNAFMETKSYHAWHQSWLFLLAIGCLLAEWLLRRKRGLA